MSDAAPGDRRPHRQIDEAGDVRRPHHTLVEHGHVLKEVIGVDVLLVHRADEVVIRHPRDRQHWCLVEPGVVQAVQQVNRSRARGGEAHSEPACVLRVSACRERCRLFVPDVHEADAVLVLAQALDHAVDAVAGKAEDHLHAEVGEALDQDGGRRLPCHVDKTPASIRVANELECSSMRSR